MSDDELFKNINRIGSTWRFMPSGIQKTKALILVSAIKTNGVSKGSSRGLKQIEFKKAYDTAVQKLCKLANDAPSELFPRMYSFVVRFASTLYDEYTLLENVFICPKRYREIQRGNFISKIDTAKFADALYYGCKTAILYEIKQIALLHPKFKGRSSTEFLRIVSTSKKLELTQHQARGYLLTVSGVRYHPDRISKLYLKLL